MIEVRNLTKRFGRFTAVDDLSFTVGRGEAVALWGACLLYTSRCV